MARLFDTRWVFVLTMVLGLGFGVVTVAEDTGLANRVAALGDDEFEVRQQATFALLKDDNLDLTELAGFFADNKPLEQRHRLVDILRHHLIRKRMESLDLPPGRASIGIGLLGLTENQTPGMDRPVIIVTTTYPGFPGHAHLQRDDMIYALNGRRIPMGLDRGQVQNFCTDLIKNAGVGELLELSVMRDGEQIQLMFKLVPFEALGHLYQTRSTIRQAPLLKDDQEKMIHEQLVKMIPEIEKTQPRQLEKADVSGDELQAFVN